MTIASSLPCQPMLAAAGKWFLESGIRNEQGGVARYYRSDSGYLPVSTEITGYTVSALCWLYRVTGEEKYLAAAQQSAEFLLKQAWHPEYSLFPFELGNPLPPSYFFDCGIIIRGLLALWRITQKQILLDVATAAAYGMRQFRAADGRWNPILSLPDFRPAEHQRKWSQEPGCFQLKAALAWETVAELTDDDVLRGWFQDALGQSRQNEASFLPGTPDNSEVMNRLHAYCYYLEALLGRPAYQAAIQGGIQKALPLWQANAPEFERSDVNGQLLRVAVISGATIPNPSAMTALLGTYQFPGKACHALAGGFAFGRRHGAMMPMANPVSTAFCMQAIAMYDVKQAGGDPGGLADLI